MIMHLSPFLLAQTALGNAYNSTGSPEGGSEPNLHSWKDALKHSGTSAFLNYSHMYTHIHIYSHIHICGIWINHKPHDLTQRSQRNIPNDFIQPSCERCSWSSSPKQKLQYFDCFSEERRFKSQKKGTHCFPEPRLCAACGAMVWTSTSKLGLMFHFLWSTVRRCRSSRVFRGLGRSSVMEC